MRKEIGSEERDVIIGVRERVMDLIQRKVGIYQYNGSYKLYGNFECY